MLLCASSPYARKGVLFDHHARYFGKDGSDTLIWQSATRTMNPTFSQQTIDAAMEKDPADARAEYYAEFRGDVDAFITREVVDACTIAGRVELLPAAGIKYVAFTDPSGGSSDSMTLAIAHKDRISNNVVIDAVRAVKPPFSPNAVVNEFAKLLKAYRVTDVTGDRYGGLWPSERFRAHGIRYLPSERTKNDLFLAFLPMLNSGVAELLAVPRIALELVGLERRTSRGGRDSIDHAPGGHDDLANAVAGAAVLAANSRGRDRTIEEMAVSVPSPWSSSRPYDNSGWLNW